MALVGLGKVSAAHAAALGEVPGSRFIGVLDTDPERTRVAASRYGVRPYRSLDELIDDRAVYAITVCTPHRAHAATAIAAASAGRHVLVEKPMATTLAECDAMIRVAERNGVRIGVVSQRRWYPPVRRVKTVLERGGIGRPILATLQLLGWRGPEYYAMDAWRGSWSGEGGGILINQAIHHLDLLEWFMGPVVEVDAYVANLSHPAIEVEDTAIGIVRFESGALGSIVASNCQYPGLYGRIHVHGDSGCSVGVQTETGSAFVAGQNQPIEPPFNDVWTIPEDAGHIARWRRADRRSARARDAGQYYHRLQIEDFVAAVAGQREPAVNGRDGRSSVELFTALYRAQRNGGRVRLPLQPDPTDGTPLDC